LDEGAALKGSQETTNRDKMAVSGDASAATPASTTALPAELAVSKPGAQGEEPPTQGDLSVCSLFAPPDITPGDTILLQAFLHLPVAAEEAARLAREFDATAMRRAFRSLEVPIERGARVHLHLDVPKLIVADPIQSLIWWGRTEAVQFELKAPADLEIGTVVGKVMVSIDSVPIGHVQFRLGVRAGAVTRQPQPLGDQARAYKLVFISYASADRSEVLKRVQMMSVFNANFFQDLLHLEPGERWERKLYQKIDECDLFLLFWSSAAKASQWVLKEARYALARKHGDAMAPPDILPVLLEGPPPVPPPDDLKHLHFNDRLLYFMKTPESSPA
jgi:hypothetical protein